MRWRSVAVLTFLLFVSAIYSSEVMAQKVTVIQAGRLFDGTSDKLANNQVIVIQGDRIVEVGPVGSVKVPAGAVEIDLRKATVFPGLIDGHTHMIPGHKAGSNEPGWGEMVLLKDSWQYRAIEAIQDAKRDLEAGFTTVRDCGSLGTRYTDTDVRRAINEGLVPGPRMQVATIPITGTSAMTENGMTPEAKLPTAFQFADSPWEGRTEVREDIKYGADLIKIFTDWVPGSHFEPGGKLVDRPSMTLEELKAITDETHRHGLKAACHTFAGEALEYSVEGGCDSIELGDDFDQNIAQKIAEKHIFVDLGPAHVKYWEAAELKATQGKYSRVALQKASVPILLKAGVMIVFGSDAGAGPDHGTQAVDFKYLVDYGLTPAQSLRAATSFAAEMLGWQDRVGTIEKGKYADVVAVAGNPLDDITELERVKFVMKGGEVVRNDLK